MRYTAFVFIALLTLMVTATRVSLAQEIISVSQDEVELLGLEFKGLQRADQRAGISLPAQVITSPEVSSSVVNRFSGVLERWLVEPGAWIESGQVLASIRSVEVMELQQQYLLAQTAVELEQDRVQRDEELFAGGIISEQRLRQTRGGLRLVELELESLAMQLGVAGLSAEELETLSAQHEDFGLQLVRATSAGVLTHRAFLVGQHVEVNEVLATLGETNNAWVSIQVPGRLAQFINSHSMISIAGSGESLNLRQRDFEIESSSQTLEVLAQFNGASNLMPGQLLTVALHPGQDTLFVPATAVVYEGNDAFVYVQAPGGVEVRNPQLVAAGAGYLVQSGLNAGEQILVQGAALVKGMQLGLGSEQ